MSVDYKMSCLEFQAPYPGKRGWCLSQWPHSRSASNTWETSQETQLAPFIFISLIWMERWWISWKIPALWCVLGSSRKQWVSVATRLTGRQQVPLDRVLECQNLHCTISMPAMPRGFPCWCSMILLAYKYAHTHTWVYIKPPQIISRPKK